MTGEAEGVVSFRTTAMRLVEGAGFAGSATFLRLDGSRNNRLYSVLIDGTPVAVLKAYFHHPSDTRDRLRSEFGFARLAWKHGVRSMPQPLAFDQSSKLALYGFIKGRQPLSAEIDEAAIGQAIAFYRQVNSEDVRRDAKELPIASEACFTLSDHVELVRRRVNELRRGVDGHGPLEREARGFIHGELLDATNRVTSRILKQTRASRLALRRPIPTSEQCISPSDFGFHNTLIKSDRSLTFFDFEYSGWDDPAKVICDFFCQPRVPVPLAYFDDFAQAIVNAADGSEEALGRARLLFPAYKLKWCCIQLNDFLPVGTSRRRFALRKDDEEERKRTQLNSAKRMLMSCDE